MSNKVYDILKFIAQIVLPGLGTLYFALAGIWGFPYGEQVVGTIAAIDAFLGAILGISSASYYKSGKDTVGTMTIDPETDTIDFDFDDMMKSDADIENLKQVKVNVVYEGKHEAS